jgi:hypothetical protein
LRLMPESIKRTVASTIREGRTKVRNFDPILATARDYSIISIVQTMATIRNVSPFINYAVNLIQHCMGKHTHCRSFPTIQKAQKLFSLEPTI